MQLIEGHVGDVIGPGDHREGAHDPAACTKSTGRPRGQRRSDPRTDPETLDHPELIVLVARALHAIYRSRQLLSMSCP